jgi:hypothetical protein
MTPGIGGGTMVGCKAGFMFWFGARPIFSQVALAHFDLLATIRMRELRAAAALVEEDEILRTSFSNSARMYFSGPSARLGWSERSGNAISGSIILNSARWRLVFEFSARKVGPNMQTLVSARQYALTLSRSETVRNAARPKDILCEIHLALLTEDRP